MLFRSTFRSSRTPVASHKAATGRTERQLSTPRSPQGPQLHRSTPALPGTFNPAIGTSSTKRWYCIAKNLSHTPKGLHSIGKLNHVAIAVPDMAQAIAFYRDILAADVGEPHPQPDHGVTTTFVKLDNTNIELLQPLGENSPIANFLKKRPAGGIHHVCLEVKDIYASIAELQAKGIAPLTPKPKTGAHGKPVVFLNPKDCNGVLVELEEE